MLKGKDLVKNALSSVAAQLVKAKEQGQTLPRGLDRTANILVSAKQEGITVVKNDLMSYLPWVLLAIVVLVFVMRK